jgi:regulatory protein YycI of two-component signal transduction system YycFG
MKENTWKTIAVIFIILFILETLFLIYAYNLGTKTTNNEFKCSNEVCYNKNALSFDYDSNTNTCSCYDDNFDIFYQEILE